MVELLRYLPNLRSVTIGPDFSGIPASTLPSQFPKPSEVATTDAKKIREAFPDLDVEVARFSHP